MPEWLTYLLTSLGTLAVGVPTGLLAWRKFFAVEVPLSDAQIKSIEADIKVKEASAAETIGDALGGALTQVRELAKERRDENTVLRREVHSLEDRVDLIEEWAKGEHGVWDEKARSKARESDPEFPDWPPFPPRH